MKVTIWLKDGSIFKGWTLTGANLTVAGVPVDSSKLAKIDDAYVYLADGSQVYRDRVAGTLQVAGPGVSGNLTLNLEQIDELAVDTTP